MVELLEMCQHDFVTVPVDGEDLHGRPVANRRSRQTDGLNELERTTYLVRRT